jgi:hypothetical protein
VAQIQQRINFEINEASAAQADVLSIAQLELAFLIAKDCVVFFSENFSLNLHISPGQ